MLKQNKFHLHLFFSVLILFSAGIDVAAQKSVPPQYPHASPQRRRTHAEHASVPLNPTPADEVDPFIGTAKSTRRTVWESNGATFPATLTPFGMVQIAPNAYRYTDTHITGFSYLNHSSGWSSRGSFLIMPYTSPADSPSSFSHRRETSHPWQYDVDLVSYHIHCSFTATVHAGLARFIFPASTQSHILLSDVTDVTIVADTVLTGNCHGTWFIARFSKPFRLRPANTPPPSAPPSSICLHYTTTAGETIDVRTGFSHTSLAAAAHNLQQEMPDDDFGRYSRQAKQTWNALLSRIEIKGADETHRRVFYTALYHSSFMPAIISDAGVSPRRYTPLYPWDTYRSEHPLITLLDPVQEGEMIASVLMEYDRTGWLPTGNMLGNHNVELILDSYLKGVRNFDIAKACEAIRKSLLDAPYARRDMALYNNLGYVPASRVNSVSQTLEFAYDDWAAATFLQTAGASPAAADSLLRRSYNYQNIFDPATGFMRARITPSTFTDGGYCEGTEWTYSWYVPHDIRGLINLMGGDAAFSNKLSECFQQGYYVHDNEPPLHYAYLFDFSGQPWKTQEWARHITETSYSDVPGGLPGNDDLGALSSWYVLSAMGLYPVTPGRPVYEIGSPVFTACIVHLPNGRDFTIRAPGTSARNKYIRSATLNNRHYSRPWISHEDILAGGTLTLEMSPVPNKDWGAAPEDAPPSMTTGHPDFSVGPPSLSSSAAGAPSLSSLVTAASSPSTLVTDASSPSTLVTDAGQTVDWSCHISNHSAAAGTLRLDILVDGHSYLSPAVLVNAHDTARLTIPITIYRAGAHEITVRQVDAAETASAEKPLAAPLKLFIRAKPAAFVYSDLSMPMPPVLLRKDSFPVSATVKNTGSSSAFAEVTLYLNHRPFRTRRIAVLPGEEKKVRFLLAGADCTRLSTIGIGNLTPFPVRILDGTTLDTPDTASLHRLRAALVMNFDDIPAGRDAAGHEAPAGTIPDLSGSGNDGKIVGTPVWVKGLFGKAIQLNAAKGAYIRIPPGVGLDTLTICDSLTMMAWIYPMEEENFSDIICRGDWNTLQVKGSNTVVNFYSDGWEGHEAFAPTPADWNRHWHHIAGVTHFPYEDLYIDGRLVASKRMEPRDPHGETGLSNYYNSPWTIGANATDPGRIFKGYIDDVMIFRKALTREEINALMMHLRP
jgi:putative alpha-1,2-mannosidase